MLDKPVLRFEIEDGAAVRTLCNPPANALHYAAVRFGAAAAGVTFRRGDIDALLAQLSQSDAIEVDRN